MFLNSGPKYLELAENGSTATLSQSAIKEVYINVPTKNGGITKVREDVFDSLPEGVWQAVMNSLEPFQEAETGLSQVLCAIGASGAGKARREERRRLRNEKKAAKTAIKQAKASNIAGGGSFGITGAMEAVGDTIGNIFGGGEDSLPMPSDGGSMQGIPTVPDNTIMGIPKPIVYIVGGVVVLFVGGKLLKLF